jgi:molecular chaperone GrpE
VTEEHRFRSEVAAEAEPAGTAAPPDGDIGAGLAPEADEAPEAEALEAESASGGPLADARRKVSELTSDLQRLQAEYVNYKRRVERDRELIRQNATYAVLAPIIEVLDNIDRAREHGEVEGGFKATADQLERIVTNLGLTRFGEPGEVFDPTVHEALSHLGTDPEVKETTVKVLAKAGYRIGDRVVRAAQVLVVDPED